MIGILLILTGYAKICLAFQAAIPLRSHSLLPRQLHHVTAEIFSPKVNHPTTYDNDPAFSFKPLNDNNLRQALQVASRARLGTTQLSFFEEQIAHEKPNHISPAKLGRSLALRECVDAKEYFESLEFYLRVRRRVRRPIMVDLACGHGLCGLFFAALEKTVKAVILVDSRKPQSFNPILESFTEVAPWVADKVYFREKNLFDSGTPCHTSTPSILGSDIGVKGSSSDLERIIDSSGIAPNGLGQGWSHQDFLDLPQALHHDECGFVAVHACGRATDRCLTIAAAAGGVGGPIAAMPCCYTGCGQAAPYGLRRMLGKGLAADIDRAYALERAGYCVDFAAIPRCITPMNRILVAVPRGR